MINEYCMVLTTVNSDSVKKAIIESLLEQNLAACIQSMPIQSHYTWQGSVQEDNEQLLIVKSRTDLFHRIESLICNLHNYEIPQIVQIPFTNGFNPYLNWIGETTSLS